VTDARGRMQQRDARLPAGSEQRHERRRRHDRQAADPSPGRAVPGGRPGEERSGEDELRHAIVEDERTVRQLGEWLLVQPTLARPRDEPLVVQPQVDRVRARVARVQFAPHGDEAVVVGPPALRARPVAGGERGRLVEEEERRVAPGLDDRVAAPAAELEPARDPAPPHERPAHLSPRVVQAAAVAVDEPARGRRDDLTERRDAVTQRHRHGRVRTPLPARADASPSAPSPHRVHDPSSRPAARPRRRGGTAHPAAGSVSHRLRHRSA